VQSVGDADGVSDGDADEAAVRFVALSVGSACRDALEACIGLMHPPLPTIGLGRR
jgi:hypothetical protein